MTVLVLDAEAKAAPTVVRALGRNGYRVAAAAAEPAAPALRSRYVSQRLAHPHPGDDRDAFVAWVERAVGDYRADCVLPLAECSIRALHRRRERFASRVALALPPSEATEVVFHKDRVLSLARSLGVDVPVTWQPESPAEAIDLSRRLSYSTYVKARESFRGDAARARYARGRFAHNPADCIAAWTALHAVVPLPLIQDAVPGPVLAVCGAWNEGRPVCRFCYVARTAWPLSGGESAWRESISPDRAPVAEADRLLGALRWTGPAHVQFIHDTRDGRFRLLEINGRFWGSLDAAHYCGVPVAVRAVELALGHHPAACLRYAVGVRSRSIESDLKRLYAVAFQRDRWDRQSLQMPGLRECLFSPARGLAPGVHEDGFYPDDPFVGVAILLRAVRRAAGLRDACFDPLPDGDPVRQTASPRDGSGRQPGRHRGGTSTEFAGQQAFALPDAAG
jgi:predicted ATP-grasp superfamily ATP-dependent carboligase